MELDVHAIDFNPFEKLNKRWMLLSCTDGVKANSMTAGWGGMGVIWERDVFFCLVRPTRFTYELLQKTDTITLSFFGEDCREDLSYLGRASGRDEDKLALCGLSPVIEEKTVYFKEAKLVITGKLIAQTDLSSSDLLDRGLESFYPKKDYHRLYVCEMLRAFTQD